jgi:hypothetical protein
MSQGDTCLPAVGARPPGQQPWGKGDELHHVLLVQLQQLLRIARGTLSTVKAGATGDLYQVTSGSGSGGSGVSLLNITMAQHRCRAISTTQDIDCGMNCDMLESGQVRMPYVAGVQKQ